MATVYLAHDLRHDRKVALKVLRPELAAVVGGERFLSEIRTTANLQHPHILPLFDSGEADGFLYYVMPYVEGESLRDKLDRERQLPVDEAIRIASAVAGALDYAHRQEVIHRDIKPANILLHDGQPLVADFGIALAVSAAGGGRLTETGLSLGTPYYMSPEQATADRDPDARSDVYSLGCVLYEMLTGETPFPGSTAQAVLAKILTSDPIRPTEHRKTIPVGVEAVVLKTLAKLPADRFGTAAELAGALADPSAALARSSDRAGAAPRSLGRAERLVWSLAVATAAAVAFWPSGGSDAPGRIEPARYNINLPAQAPMGFIGAAALGNGRRAFAVSADGRVLVYAGLEEGVSRLYVRAIDSYETRVLPGTEGAYGPFFSPNAAWVGFFVGNQLMKVRTEGGTPLYLAEAPNSGGAAWGPDSRIVFGVGEGGALASVSDQGGEEPRPFVNDAIWPHMLPEGRGVLFSSRFGFRVADPDGRNAQPLAVGGNYAVFAPPGFLVVARGSDLLAARFDLRSLEVRSSLVPVTGGVRAEVFGQGQWDVTADGTLVYASGGDVRAGPLTWIDAEGDREGLSLPNRVRGTFEVSPDGRQLAVVEETTASSHVWVYDIAAGRPQQLTVDHYNWGALSWMPGGDLLFHRLIEGRRAPYVTSTSTGGGARPLLPDHTDVSVQSISPDGRLAAFLDDAGTIGVIDLETGERTDLPAPGNTNWGTVVSPDARAAAYTSEHTGEYHIYVQPLPPTGDIQQVSLVGGSEEPRWTADGRQLFYRSGRRLMHVEVQTEPELVVGVPEVFYEGDFVNVGGRSYDIAPDGSRALVIDGGASTTTTLNVVRGWLGEVERLIAESEAGSGS
jgi:serine/threonine-protein kinase